MKDKVVIGVVAVVVIALVLYSANARAAVGTSGVRVHGAQDDESVYKPGSTANARLKAAQDAWYAFNPDAPFVNDDGTYNYPPGYPADQRL